MATVQKSRAYWVRAKGIGELREEEIAAESASLVRASFSGVSQGSERLVGLGRVPDSCEEAMACRYMGGGFRLPIKYGYCLVGEALSGANEGRRVFTMHPHQELVQVRDEDLIALPASIPSPRAVLYPNLETAWNGVADAEITTRERAVIVGGGAVGCLIAFVLKTRGHETLVVEIDEARRERIAALSWIDRVVVPDDVCAGGAELAFHTSASSSGLATAIGAVGFEGRVIELSWFGDQEIRLELGASFHYQRKRIIASQVSSIARPLRATHGFAERTAAVLDILADPRLDELLAAPVSFDDMPELMSAVYEGSYTALVPLIAYRG